MEKLSVEKEAVEEKLADSDLYTEENKETLKLLLADQAYVQKELDQAEAEWLAASEEHENLTTTLKESA